MISTFTVRDVEHGNVENMKQTFAEDSALNFRALGNGYEFQGDDYRCTAEFEPLDHMLKVNVIASSIPQVMIESRVRGALGVV